MSNRTVSYSDPATGKQYTETSTSPIATTVRQEELTEAGYIVNDD